MPSDPITTSRSTACSGISGFVQIAAPVRRHRFHDVADERLVLHPARRESRRFVAAPDHHVRRLLDLLHLVAVDDLLVAGEVDRPRSAARAAPGRWRTAPRCPARRPPAAPFPSPAFRVGVPVGPIRITGSPGFSSAHRSDDPPISSTMVESNPFSRSTDAPVSASPSIASVVPFGPRRQRFVILQPIELPRLERPRRHRRPHHHFHDVRRQPDHFVHHRAQFVVQLARSDRAGDGSAGARARQQSRHHRIALLRAAPSPSPRCPQTTDADRRRS